MQNVGVLNSVAQVTHVRNTTLILGILTLIILFSICQIVLCKWKPVPLPFITQKSVTQKKLLDLSSSQ